MTPEVYQAASARSSRRCSPGLVTKQPTIRKRAKRGKKERTGEYSADEASPTTATPTLSSAGPVSELGGGGHPNQKYPMAHEHFVIYARKKHDKRTTWKDVTTAFNKAIGPTGPQNPGLDMYVTQPERSLNLPAQREQAGVTSMYYRTNKVIPVMDGRGGLVYGDDGEPLLEWIHERDTSRSPPGLIERYPEIVLDRDYWFVSDEDKRWAAHLSKYMIFLNPHPFFFCIGQKLTEFVTQRLFVTSSEENAGSPHGTNSTRRRRASSRATMFLAYEIKTFFNSFHNFSSLLNVPHHTGVSGCFLLGFFFFQLCYLINPLFDISFFFLPSIPLIVQRRTPSMFFLFFFHIQGVRRGLILFGQKTKQKPSEFGIWEGTETFS